MQCNAIQAFYVDDKHYMKILHRNMMQQTIPQCNAEIFHYRQENSALPHDSSAITA